LPESDVDTWQTLCKRFNYDKAIILQTGGETRFQSVRNGLEKIEGDGLVAIHDGVRPLVTEKIIAESFRLAKIHNTAIAAVSMKDSIRQTQDGATKAVDRSQFKLIQTPQTFSVRLIKDAYQLDEDASLTDDASVAEKAGIKITLFEGSYENIKITTDEDLIVAKALLQSREGIKSM
jgi:2-C-methyl-D-erythritol 4-phosphate cytidylyltransferase